MTTPHQAPGRCRDLLAELFDYLDHDLSPDRCRALERHLDNCPCCGDLAENLRKAIALCQVEGRRRVPAAVRARARRRVTELLSPNEKGSTPRGR